MYKKSRKEWIVGGGQAGLVSSAKSEMQYAGAGQM